jgi:hypothetical protein
LSKTARDMMPDTGVVSVSSLAKYCANVLPELVCVMAKQSDPSVTPEVVKQLGKSPFKLATIVMQQIEQNRVISDIADFFEQVLPVMKALWGSRKMDEETPSS